MSDSVELVGVRYVTGRTLDLDGPGAVVHVRAGEAALAALVARLGAFGPCQVRRYAAHVAIGVRSEPDVVEPLADALEALTLDPAASVDDWRATVAGARRSSWASVRERALARGLPVLLDDEAVSVGFGARSATFGLAARPRAFGGLGRVPLALVTGTNGKTTTTRFIAAMGSAAGHTVGHTSSDGIFIGGQCLERGDWSGPGAARRVLRHGRVTFAVLETARGGMLRRGVQVDAADVAVVTNVSADHLGQWGVDTVDAMAEVKLLVADSLRPGGTLVLNADAWRWPGLLDAFRARRPDVAVRWFSTTRAADACVQDGALMLDGARLVRAAAVPLTFGGRAAHNVENALAAALAGRALGLSRRQVAAGLRALTPDPEHSAGRANAFTVPVGRGSATVFVDFAHNPEGLRHLAALASTWRQGGRPPRRRLLLIGQAGDRTDDVLDDTVRASFAMGPAHVFLKEMARYARGRPAGQVVDRMRVLYAAEGIPTSTHADELEATDAALDALRPGDFLLLLAHVDAAAVVERVRARIPAPPAA